jgi:hypothetical protein
MHILRVQNLYQKWKDLGDFHREHEEWAPIRHEEEGQEGDRRDGNVYEFHDADLNGNDQVHEIVHIEGKEAAEPEHSISARQSAVGVQPLGRAVDAGNSISSSNGGSSMVPAVPPIIVPIALPHAVDERVSTLPWSMHSSGSPLLLPNPSPTAVPSLVPKLSLVELQPGEKKVCLRS